MNKQTMCDKNKAQTNSQTYEIKAYVRTKTFKITHFMLGQKKDIRGQNKLNTNLIPKNVWTS